MNPFFQKTWLAMSLSFLATVLSEAPFLSAQDAQNKAVCDFFERYSDWPEDLKISGTVLLTDSLEGLKHYIVSSEYSRKKIVRWVVVGASESTKNSLLGPEFAQAAAALSQLTWVQQIDQIESLDTESQDADTMLILCDDRPVDAISKEDLQAIGQAIEKHRSKGAVAGFVGPACVALGKQTIEPAPSEAFTNGLGLIPDALVCFNQDGQFDPNVCQAIRADQRCVLLTIAKGNAWVLQGRKGMLYGPGVATVWIGPGEHSQEQSARIQAKSPSNRNQPESYLVDWTQWRRLAIERTLEPFPPAQRQRPHVPNGSLVIVGGGGMPPGLMKTFVELAGGPRARIVYVPCAEEEDVSGDTRLLDLWKQIGAQSATLVHTKDRRIADQDPRFYEPFKDATGIWFGGGRQWNLADSYYGTQTHRLMKQVLDRGGVIGGSSAGASIQGNYLARATPIENFRIMAPGYERGGLGFLSGVAIDQHFTQRRRQKDLRSLVDTYPQMLGIGIDENTAILVKKSMAQVIGPGNVTFNWKEENQTQIEEFVGAQGDLFDLANRMQIKPD